MKDFIHLVYVPFTGLGLHSGYRGDDWFEYRIGLFRDYTLKSLVNQTCHNFTLWLSFRPQEKDNPLTKKLEEIVKQSGLKYVFTYGGLMFYDDKFANDNLMERYQQTLPDLREIVGGKAYVYETLQPSDDMFDVGEMERIQQQEPKERRALVHKGGFLFDEPRKMLAEWNPATNPPFYTLIYPAEVFLDPQKHFEYMKGFRSHEDITKLFNCVSLPDRKYCVLVHKRNISTNWWHPFRGKAFKRSKAKEILKDFGIDLDEQNGRSYSVVVRYYLAKVLMWFKLYKYVKWVKNKCDKKVRLPDKDR